MGFGLCYGRSRWDIVLLICVVFVVHTIRSNVIEPDTDVAGTIGNEHSFGTDSDEITIKETSLISTNKNRQKRSLASSHADIARFVDNTKMTMGVYVDGTMKRLIFRVVVQRSSPVIQITMPSGVPSTSDPTIHGKASAGETVTATIDILINSTDYGYWKFTRLDGNIWNVTVQGDSPVFIQQQLLEIGTSTPVTTPIVGSEYKLLLQMTGYSNIKLVLFGLLFSPSKYTPLTSFGPLISKGNGKYEVAKIKMPAETFMVGIQGKDKNGRMFQRIDPTEITPVLLKLDVSPSTDANVLEYSTFNIKFTVTNLLNTTQDIDVRISDPRGFSQAPTTLSAILKHGENFTGMFALKTSFAGLSSLVKITAFQIYGPGNYSTGPVEFRTITVIKNDSTTTSSTTPTTPTTTPSTQSSTSSTSTLASTISAPFSTSTTGTTVVKSSMHTNYTTSIGSVTSVLPSTLISSTISASSTKSSIGMSTKIQQTSGTSKVGTSTYSKKSVSGNTASTSLIYLISSSTSSSVGLRRNHSSTHSPHGGKGISTIRNTPSGINAMTTGLASIVSLSTTTDTNKDSSKDELSAGVIVACMVAGAAVGVAAIATMAIIFSKALAKKKRQIAPEDKKTATEKHIQRT